MSDADTALTYLAPVSEVAVDSQIARYSWKDRGRASSGYIKGMALVYASLLEDLANAGPVATEMAMAPRTDSKDALGWYQDRFAAAGLESSGAGRDTLRHLFVLMTGLGMRESSGRACEGRDQSASNGTADTAEAGLFQCSQLFLPLNLGTKNIGLFTMGTN